MILQNVLPQLEKLKGDACAVHRVDVESKLRAESCSVFSQFVTDREKTGSDLLLKYETAVRDIQDKAAQSSATQREEIQQLQHLINAVQGIGDEDLEIQENLLQTSTHQLRCPFTNAELTNPIKNSECRHVYSLNGVLSCFAQNAQVSIPQSSQSLDIIPSSWSARCPVVGCNAKIRRNQLKKDYQTELTQRQMAMSTRRDSVDIDDVGDDVEEIGEGV